MWTIMSHPFITIIFIQRLKVSLHLFTISNSLFLPSWGRKIINEWKQKVKASISECTLSLIQVPGWNQTINELLPCLSNSSPNGPIWLPNILFDSFPKNDVNFRESLLSVSLKNWTRVWIPFWEETIFTGSFKKMHLNVNIERRRVKAGHEKEPPPPAPPPPGEWNILQFSSVAALQEQKCWIVFRNYFFYYFF